MVHCGSAFEPGASGLPYYGTPPVVIGALAVWRQNILKKNCQSMMMNWILLRHGVKCGGHHHLSA